MTGFDPYEYANGQGIEVIHRPISSVHGLWLPDYQTIVVRSGLSQRHERCVLTHELAHAHFGHTQDSPKNEFQADRWAARKLINPHRLRDLVAWSGDAAEIAAELVVSTRLVRVYLEQAALPLVPWRHAA